jgi:hypothetical protein
MIFDHSPFFYKSAQIYLLILRYYLWIIKLGINKYY